jgi:hypothetical protein
MGDPAEENDPSPESVVFIGEMTAHVNRKKQKKRNLDEVFGF